MSAGGQAFVGDRMLRIDNRHNTTVSRLKLRAKPKSVPLALAVLGDDRRAGAVDMPYLRVMVCLRGDVIQEHLDDLEQRSLVKIAERPATAGDARIVYTLPFAAEGRQS